MNATASESTPTLATRVRYLLELIRFSHTVFALPFALLAGLLAWTANSLETPPVPWRWRELVGIVLAMVTARSTAMAFNRIVDRQYDAENPRTARRHLPAGLLSLASVVTFALASAAGFVASTLLFWPNPWPVALAVPVLAFVCGYSYAKRFTSLVHFWLGAALMLAPCAAWLAIRASLDWPPVILGLAVLSWVAGFDIIYACQDVEYDRRRGLASIPVRLGVAGALRLSAVCHAATLVALALLPVVFPPLGAIYGLGLAAVAVLLIYEHRLVRPDDLDRVNEAFFQVNAVISLGLLAVGALDLWW